jgi:hypothetical protein
MFADKAHVIISGVILGPMYARAWVVGRQEWMESLGMTRRTQGRAWRVTSDKVHAMSGAKNVEREIEEEEKKESRLLEFRTGQKEAEKRRLGPVEREMKLEESRALVGEDERKMFQTKLWEMEMEIIKNLPIEERQSMIRSRLADL